MKDLQKRLNRLFETMTDAEKELAIRSKYVYIFSKAELFLRSGYETYQKNDAFKQPDSNLTTDEIEILIDGCRQVIDGRGLTKERAFTNLDVAGFYTLMRLFHFEPISKETIHGFEMKGIKGALDKITFKHIMDAETTTLFNFCEYPQLL